MSSQHAITSFGPCQPICSTRRLCFHPPLGSWLRGCRADGTCPPLFPISLVCSSWTSRDLLFASSSLLTLVNLLCSCVRRSSTTCWSSAELSVLEFKAWDIKSAVKKMYKVGHAYRAIACAALCRRASRHVEPGTRDALPMMCVSCVTARRFKDSTSEQSFYTKNSSNPSLAQRLQGVNVGGAARHVMRGGPLPNAHTAQR